MRTLSFIGLSLSLLFVRQAAASSFVQQARLVASDGAPGDGFGREVALSADASVALVAAADANCGAGPHCGAVYVFVRTKNGWREQIKLTASDATAGSELGRGIALSADGSTALARARSNDCLDTPNCAVVYVFRRLRGIWLQQARLKTAGTFWSLDFGLVALSGDGRTALVGSPASCEGPVCGVVHVFLRQGETWSEETRLRESAARSFGNSVALSRDGLTALVAAEEREAAPTSTGEGGVFSYVKKRGAWKRAQELPTLVPYLSEIGLGQVSLSGDGGTALVSTPDDGCTHELENPDENSFCGSVRIYSRAGGAWIERQVLKTPGEHGLFGDRSALSGNGFLALIPSLSSIVFSRSAETWSERQRVGIATAVSLSGDGRMALLGAHREGCAVGAPCSAAYVLTLIP